MTQTVETASYFAKAKRWLPWAITSVCLSVGALLTIRAAIIQLEFAGLRTQRDLSETARRLAELQLAERTLLAQRIVQDMRADARHTPDLARMRKTSLKSSLSTLTQAHAIILWDATAQRGILVAEGLPAIGADLSYQLWLHGAERGQRTAGALFSAEPTGEALTTIAPAVSGSAETGFSLTIEPRNGSAQPSGPVILSAN